MTAKSSYVRASTWPLMALLVCLIAGLYGCSKDQEPAADAEASTSSRPVAPKVGDADTEVPTAETVPEEDGPAHSESDEYSDGGSRGDDGDQQDSPQEKKPSPPPDID